MTTSTPSENGETSATTAHRSPLPRALRRPSPSRNQNNGNGSSSSSSNNNNNNTSRPSAHPRLTVPYNPPPPRPPQRFGPPSSTWPTFMLHFMLPMMVFFMASNFTEFHDATIPDFLLSNPRKAPTSSSSSSSLGEKQSVKPSSLPTQPLPDSNYQSEINAAIQRRAAQHNNKQKGATKTATKAATKTTTSKTTPRQRSKSTTTTTNRKTRPTGPQSSPLYQQMEGTIKTLKSQYEASRNTPSEYLSAMHYADFLKHRDVTIHDGGTHQMEAISVYTHATNLLEDIWRTKMARGEETRSLSSPDDILPDRGYAGLNAELFFDYESKSIEGMLCTAYTSLGKVYFMSNMFERAVECYEECLSYDRDYLDALTYRAQSFLILGKYKEAGKDYRHVLERDVDRIFVDSVSGFAKVVTAKEDAVEGGWDFLVDLLKRELPLQLASYRNAVANESGAGIIKHYADGLKRMHHAMFAYHDVKTKDATAAWNHLAKGNEYKLSTIPPFNAANKIEQVTRVKSVFSPSFFPGNIGSQTRTPIFIIGFVRSGSTLLERILDAHPSIVGTGEDSVFNGRLDTIRNEIVEASMVGDPRVLNRKVKELADDVVSDMKSRWEVIDANMHNEDDHEEESEERPYPLRFADKMLTNYINVGFLHLLFPNALILHVAREPMDSIFSAFKHDFPPGGLDYTSEFAGLAQLYHCYRDTMEHLDKVLPGRVTHVRYEDMVTDFENVAPKIIEAAGVPWDPTVLDFHKKKHAVNTLSTTQVRKGVYSHHFKGWKRYEKFLEPLLDLVGSRVEYDLKTTLSGYLKTGVEPVKRDAAPSPLPKPRLKPTGNV